MGAPASRRASAIVLAAGVALAIGCLTLERVCDDGPTARRYRETAWTLGCDAYGSKDMLDEARRAQAEGGNR